LINEAIRLEILGESTVTAYRDPKIPTKMDKTWKNTCGGKEFEEGR